MNKKLLFLIPCLMFSACASSPIQTKAEEIVITQNVNPVLFEHTLTGRIADIHREITGETTTFYVGEVITLTGSPSVTYTYLSTCDTTIYVYQNGCFKIERANYTDGYEGTNVAFYSNYYGWSINTTDYYVES